VSPLPVRSEFPWFLFSEEKEGKKKRMFLCEEIQTFLLGISSDDGQLTSQLISLPVCYSSET
jgi:hypothetical protein